MHDSKPPRFVTCLDWDVMCLKELKHEDLWGAGVESTKDTLTRKSNSAIWMLGF